jgi:hypothetical protein
MPDESRSLDQYTIATWQNGVSTHRSLDQYAFVVWSDIESVSPSDGGIYAFQGYSLLSLDPTGVHPILQGDFKDK